MSSEEQWAAPEYQIKISAVVEGTDWIINPRIHFILLVGTKKIPTKTHIFGGRVFKKQRGQVQIEKRIHLIEVPSICLDHGKGSEVPRPFMIPYRIRGAEKLTIFAS